MKFLKELGIKNPTKIYQNESPEFLTKKAIEQGAGVLSETGALVVKTGERTGRSPNDKFIVDTPGIHNDIDWGKVNVPIEQTKFNALRNKMCDYLSNKEIYIFDGFVGADTKYSKKIRVICELASQAMFTNNLLIRPTAEELANFNNADFTVIVTPKYKANPESDGVNSTAAIMIDYEQKMVLITGTGYSGEIKKSVFSIMNFLMPKENVLPMHCSANMDSSNNNTAIFFGLSGTGKTTLSADPKRLLIGDDEHGWSENGIFNFEGGCYAKCIDLDPEKEPDIYDAIKDGALVENVILDNNGKPDYSNNSITNNTRVGYPIDYIKNAAIPSIGGIPSTVIFLTADSFGVLPPISKLSKFAAMYHFVTGFTSKVAGTEEGIIEPIPTFSTLFGQPFMPLSPNIYAKMFGEKIEKYNTKVYLINTGWTGGPFGIGKRINLSYTRAMVSAALNGSIEDAEFVHNDIFNLEVPQSCSGVPNEILNPKNTWEDKDAYDTQAKKLAKMFQDNFTKKYSYMSNEIILAGPQA